MLNNLIHEADRVFLSDSFVLNENSSNEYIFIKILGERDTLNNYLILLFINKHKSHNCLFT